MAQQLLNVPSNRLMAPNTGDGKEFGDPIADAYAKINAMFQELYETMSNPLTVNIDHTTPGTTDQVVSQGAAPVFMPADIANGASVSSSVDGGGGTLCAVHVPASFEGGYVEFEVAEALDGTYGKLTDTSGSIIRYKVQSSVAATVIAVTKSDFFGVRFLKIRSVSSDGTHTNQTTASAVVLSFTP